MTEQVASITVLALALSGSVTAEVVPGLDIERLVNTAELIVVGTLADVTDSGPATLDNGASGRLMNGRFVIRQTLKGSINTASVDFRSKVWLRAVQTKDVATNTEAIGFLKRRGDHVEFVSPFYPVLRTVATPRIEASDPLQAVVEGMTAVFRVPGAPTTLKQQVLFELSRPAIPIAATRAGLRPALQDPDRGIRLAALATLLANNDVEALPLVEAILLPPRTLDAEEMVAGLREGLTGLKDPTAVPGLTRLLTSGDAATRRAAAAAMGNIRSKMVLRPLGRALDDEDSEVRFNVVQSLADAIGNDLLRTNPQQFKKQGAQNVKDWKARLAELGVDLR
jgi:hypothetical protein